MTQCLYTYNVIAVISLVPGCPHTNLLRCYWPPFLSVQWRENIICESQHSVGFPPFSSVLAPLRFCRHGAYVPMGEASRTDSPVMSYLGALWPHTKSLSILHAICICIKLNGPSCKDFKEFFYLANWDLVEIQRPVGPYWKVLSRRTMWSDLHFCKGLRELG